MVLKNLFVQFFSMKCHFLIYLGSVVLISAGFSWALHPEAPL